MFFIGIDGISQSKLIVFSENSSTFNASVDDHEIAKEGNNFFEFDNLKNQSVLLNIICNNKQKLKKEISIEKNRQKVYALVLENEKYKLRYRGEYLLSEKPSMIPSSVNYTRKTRTNPGLLSINDLLDRLKTANSDEIKTSLIIEELKKGNYNCRQLNHLFGFLKNDQNKLKIFSRVHRNCIDIQNYKTLLESIKDKDVRYLIVKQASLAHQTT